MSAATQITRILCHPLEASDLIQAAEVLLSCAETLTTQSGENELSALQAVQAAAQQAGARFRSIRLIIVRADSLAQLGRTSEALAVLDELLAQLDATPGTTARGDAFFVRQARKEIAV